MTRWCVVLGVLGACTTTDPAREGQRQQASSSATFQENFSGTEATADFRDQTTSVHVDLFENTSNVNPGETFVFYQYGVADPSSLVCYGYCFYARWTYDYGYGAIPSSDAQITPGAAQLHTSTTVAGFTTQHCVFDSRDGTATCGAGLDGSIDVTWQQDGFATRFSSGTSRETTPAWSYQTEGTYWTSSAQASGSLAGNTFDTAYGALNDTHQNTVMKSFTRTTP